MGMYLTSGGSGSRCCPFCAADAIVRLWLAGPGLDSCECHTCWARWEEAADGTYRGRVTSAGGWSTVQAAW